MPGLLDFLNTDEGRLGLGLLAAAGPRSDGMGFGGRVQEAFAGEDARKKAQAQSELQKLQMEDARGQLAQRQQEAARDQQMRELAQRFQRPAQQGLAPLAGDPAAGILPSAGRAAVPAGFDYEGYAGALAGFNPIGALELQRSLQKDDAPVTLKPGEQMFSGKASGYKPLLSVPGKESLGPAAVQEYQFAKDQGYPGSFVDFQLAQKRAGASSVSVNTGQRGLDNTLKLRGDFRSEPIYKAHQEVQSAYSQIVQSLDQASPAGDLAGATKFMKILDPGSVVRESELGMAMAASGAMDRLQHYTTNVMNGTKLTPTQRADFKKLATSLYSESSKQYNTKRGEYQGIAERNGLSTADVLGSEATTQHQDKPNTVTGGSGLSITAPNGKTYTFKSQGEMNNFKMATGAK